MAVYEVFRNAQKHNFIRIITEQDTFDWKEVERPHQCMQVMNVFSRGIIFIVVNFNRLVL